MKFSAFLIISFFISITSYAAQDSFVNQKPKIQPGEMTVYFKETYHIFKVVEFKNLKLSDNCFSKTVKGKKLAPQCQAYDVAQIKVKDVAAAQPGQTHYASSHCTRLMGQNLIAYDHFNNEYDYCRFPDDSLVSSWSMFNNSFQRAKN